MIYYCNMTVTKHTTLSHLMQYIKLKKKGPHYAIIKTTLDSSWNLANGWWDCRPLQFSRNTKLYIYECYTKMLPVSFAHQILMSFAFAVSIECNNSMWCLKNVLSFVNLSYLRLALLPTLIFFLMNVHLCVKNSFPCCICYNLCVFLLILLVNVLCCHISHGECYKHSHWRYLQIGTIGEQKMLTCVFVCMSVNIQLKWLLAVFLFDPKYFMFLSTVLCKIQSRLKNWLQSKQKQI